MKKTAIVADQVAVVETPVDTGRARANWLVTIGAPSNEVMDPEQSGESGTASRASSNTQKALDHAQAVISAYQIDAGPIISITNNVEYIQPLDDGTASRQGGQMSAKAVQAARQVVKREKVLRGI